MKNIDATDKPLRALLSNVKYSIDYYQREYQWQTKNVQELLDDLEAKFLSSHNPNHSRAEVQKYAHYFLGSIILYSAGGQHFIIDGQQRLTTLTLLLIYLHHLLSETPGSEDDISDLKPLIFSTSFGKKSFNLDVQERIECVRALFETGTYEANGQPESVHNVAARYEDIKQLFPEMLKNHALPFFKDWLIECVDMVEIVASSDEDAYTIFETMNDRGMSLSPTDMLKGYLLANIEDPPAKVRLNASWKERIVELSSLGRDDTADFFKNWLRAKYANTIRDHKQGATNRDFEKIGTTFHKWVRDERERIGLKLSEDYQEFLDKDFTRFSQYYIGMRKAAQTMTPGWEYIYYNAYNNFTLQYLLALATIRVDDDLDTVERKIRLVTGYLDILIARRIVNFRTLSYSSVVYTMFNLMKEIRDLDVPDLVALLHKKVDEMEETFDHVDRFYLHKMNGRSVHYLLARITHHIERESHIDSYFDSYVARDVKKPFEIEHIWPNKPERFKDEFPQSLEFQEYRNRLGGLVLLPRGFNQSLGDDTYDVKVKAYFGQNLRAKSLNDQCYQNNPSFLSYLKQSKLPFRSHPEFRKVDLDTRQELYRLICEEIWSPERFDRELM